PQATAIFPAHRRAASSSATSTTARPPRYSLLSAYGPSVNSGVPLEASALNTGPSGSSPPVKMSTPAAFISALSAPTLLDVSRNSSSVMSGTQSSLNAMRYSVMSPPLCGARPVRPPSIFSTNGGSPIRHGFSAGVRGAGSASASAVKVTYREHRLERVLLALAGAALLAVSESGVVVGEAP